MKLSKIKLPDIYFTITCSKGTFIRVIAEDFGKKLNSGGILFELRRIGIGDYQVEEALSVNEFTKQYSVQIAAQ